MKNNTSNLLTELDFIENDLSEHWSNERQLKKRIIDAIYNMMEEMDKNEIRFSNDEYEDVNHPWCTYDGGNHPEYASTINAQVDRIQRFIKKYQHIGLDAERKAICVDIIDCENNVEDTRLDLVDIVSIFDSVAEIYSDFIKD